MSTMILLIISLAGFVFGFLFTLMVKKRWLWAIGFMITTVGVTMAVIYAVQMGVENGTKSAEEKWVNAITQDVDDQTVADNNGTFSYKCDVIVDYVDGKAKIFKLVADSSTVIDQEDENVPMYQIYPTR